MLTEQSETIMRELAHGPLNPADLAEATGVAPFAVRSELKALKRARLVLEHLTTRRHEFELADRGHDALRERDQLRIGGVR